MIEFTPSSELSFAVLRAVLPTESQVNAQTFRHIFREMFIRLETVEPLGDYEVIAIQTIAQNGLLLGMFEFDNNDNWNVIEEFAKKIGNREDIWYATNIEIYDYVNSNYNDVTGNITFDSNQATIKYAFQPVLNSIAKVIKEYNKTMVQVNGYTDSTGSTATNNTLSFSAYTQRPREAQLH